MGKLMIGNNIVSPVIVNGSSTPSGTTDVPLTRISDDNGNEIGTWYMNFEDANGNVFKVVLLDAQYRNASTQWINVSASIINMPSYSDLKNSNIWEAKETATQNTQLIVDHCRSKYSSSSACNHCRSKSFIIGGITYYGQLPNYVEVNYIAKHYNQFDVLDISASSQSSLNFSSARAMWTSSQYSGSYCWGMGTSGILSNTSKTNPNTNYFACPVLEISVS